MAIAQDYWSIGSPRFGRAQLTQKLNATYVPMTQPLYWAAVGMQTTLASAVLAGVGTNQQTGMEYQHLASFDFDRKQLTRGTAQPYLPMVQPLYFGQDLGVFTSAIASAVLAATGAETSLGTLATTLANAVLAGTGSEKDSGTLATTLTSALLAATGHETDSGTLATILANALLASTGTVKDSGTLATTLASAALAATGSVKATGTLATTLANAVLAATGSERETGHLATALASVVLAGTGGVTETGHLATTLASAILAVTGVDYTGKLASILASASFSGVGAVPPIPGASYPQQTKSPTYILEDGPPSAITGYVSGFALNAKGHLVSVDDTSQPRTYLWGIPIDSYKRVILAERFKNILFENGPTVCLFSRVN